MTHISGMQIDQRGDHIYFSANSAGFLLCTPSVRSSYALSREEAKELLNCLRRLLERTEPKKVTRASEGAR